MTLFVAIVHGVEKLKEVHLQLMEMLMLEISNLYLVKIIYLNTNLLKKARTNVVC